MLPLGHPKHSLVTGKNGDKIFVIFINTCSVSVSVSHFSIVFFFFRFVRIDGIVLSVSSNPSQNDVRSYSLNTGCRLVRRRLDDSIVDPLNSNDGKLSDSVGRWIFSVEIGSEANVFAAVSSAERYQT